MDVLTFAFQVVQLLIIGLIVMAALLIALAVTVSLMPKDNPLRQLLVALIKPIGTTVAVAAVAAPVEFIPVIDMIYDLAGMALVIWSWISFAREALVIVPNMRREVAVLPPENVTILPPVNRVR